MIRFCQIRNFGVQKSLWRTHYDVLNLPKSCTQKEIRDAYVKLCKDLHPDSANKKPMENVEYHRKFTELNEAYSVLSKPQQRRDYDHRLLHKNYSQFNNDFYHRPDVTSDFPKRNRPWTNEDYNNWYNDLHRAKSSKGYYGFSGFSRVSNIYIVGFCLVIMFCGMVVHMMTFWYRKSIKQLVEPRQQAERIEAYYRAKGEYEKYGREGQLRRIIVSKIEDDDDDKKN